MTKLHFGLIGILACSLISADENSSCNQSCGCSEFVARKDSSKAAAATGQKSEASEKNKFKQKAPVADSYSDGSDDSNMGPDDSNSTDGQTPEGSLRPPSQQPAPGPASKGSLPSPSPSPVPESSLRPPNQPPAPGPAP